MNEEKIKELFSNEEYVKGLFELGSYEKASEKLAEDGIDVSPEELKKVVELASKKADGQLSDEELEEVAGGLTELALMMGLVIGSVVVGTGVSVGAWYVENNDC